MYFVKDSLTNLAVLPIVLRGVIGIWFGSASVCLAYTPESPEVRSMVARGARFLARDHIYDEPHRALAAMAIFKSGGSAEHPVVAESLKECVDMCRTPEVVDRSLRSVYGASVVGILLCEVDPVKYKKEIANVIQSLEKRQKPFGGWGYPKPQTNWEYGDTSMTQYAILCAWIAKNTGGAEISRTAMEGVTNWLIRTQDPGGAWGYQGRDPGVGVYTQRIPQREVRHSLCAAGLGSLYICSAMLGFTPDIEIAETPADLPAALKPIAPTSTPTSSAAATTRTASTGVDERLLKRAVRDGNKWYKANYRINPSEYTLYYLYTLERYQSFKEIAEGRKPKEPRWYNDGVRFLRSKQQRDGSWDLPNGNGDLADTAFAMLFLLRGTQKTIQKSLAELDGRLVAGRGIPGNTQDVRLKQGNVITTPFQGTADALLEILSDRTNPVFDNALQVDEVDLSDDPRQRTRQIERMRRLVHAEAYQVRLLAVRTLAKHRDLENVPTLIYALSDPDTRVMLAARDALRFIGRKFTGFGLSEEPTEEERERVTRAWKEWYLQIRPNAKFPG